MKHPASPPLLAILIATLLGGSLPAVEYHVADTSAAKDSNSGLAGSPWRTITWAAGRVQAGDTVHVAPGVYNDPVTVSTSGTAAKRIRFISDTRGGARINATGAAQVWFVKGSYVDVVGFDISSTDTSANGARVGINVEANHCRIINNIVHDIPCTAGVSGGSGGAGIGLGTYPPYNGTSTSATTGNECVGNFVHHIGPRTFNRQIHGIYVRDQNCLVANNITCANAGTGITSWHYATRMTVVNNLVFGSLNGGITIGGDVTTNAATLVANNIVVNNIGNAPAISEYGKAGADNRYLNNCVYGNTYFGNPTTFALLQGQAPLNTVTADARFVNYKADGSGDYHLAAGSPCIDAGTTEGALATDFDGRTRDTKYDIGPYEYAGDITAPSVPGGLTATVNSTSRITLAWTASSDNVAVAGYRIYRGGTQIATATGTTYSDTGLTASTAYAYAVAAYDTASPANVSARSATVNATTQANHTPVATAQSVSTTEGTAKAITLAGTDADGNALSFAIVANPAHGTLSGSGASRTYTPATGYSGGDSFTFTANDGTATSAAATVTITVTAVVNTAPVVSAAGATPSPVTGRTANLSAAATDNGGEAALLYTWSATGPATVTFSPNGSNAAKASVATFSKAGSYTLTVTAKDAAGLTGTKAVALTVNAITTRLSLSPTSASVQPLKTVEFNALLEDQFGAALAVQPTLTWTASGGGTIDASGLFTAGSGGGTVATTCMVTATGGGQVGTALVTVSTASTATPPGGGGCGSGAAGLIIGLGMILGLRRRR